MKKALTEDDKELSYTMENTHNEDRCSISFYVPVSSSQLKCEAVLVCSHKKNSIT